MNIKHLMGWSFVGLVWWICVFTYGFFQTTMWFLILVAMCVILIELSEKNGKDPFFTGDVYNHYRDLCAKNKTEILTQRRVSDIIQEFDMLGIINVRVISKGRGGRMREIRLAITKPIIKKAKEIIKGVLDYA